MNRDLQRRNIRTMWGLFAFTGLMIGLAFAAVPLYELFCKVTGFAGTPQVAAAATKPVGEREMTIRFNADVSGDMPWAFEPLQREVKVRVGEEKLVFYRATNRSAQAIVGTSTFNVTPDVAGIYFNKTQCFCFTEQLLKPGESIDMPVVFFVDPDLATDSKLANVATISLSYTFFISKTDKAKQMLGLNGYGQGQAGARQ
jgi:cytochrome c oxidase assembly protein subunit 11